ncbi:G5 domain-containing protein [Candidatus Saccharibacteria bacterium]|nr:G5 domain-containing protein [Candidatus Saccharibacteria bacterium]
MRLPKNHVKMSLIISGVVVSALVFASLLKIITPNTFADNAASLAPSGDIHYVTIYDQGKKLTIKTDAVTVADALSRAHFEIATTDIVEPGLTTLINDGNFHINIYRSRPVIVSDGTTKKRLETASYDPITIARDAGFSVYDGDEVNMVANTNFLEAGISTAYEITRNGGRTVTEEIAIPFEEEIVKDYTLPLGENKTEQIGEDGLRVVKYKVEFIDGAEVKRELISDDIVKEPVKRIVREGARGTTSSSTSAGENEAITWDFLKSQGFSDIQVAGIMGNLMQEHRFQTSDTAGGLGIAQWTGGRRNNLLSMANPYDIYTQLQYLMVELNGGYTAAKNSILSSTSIETATRAFQNQFERCGICREETRINYAYDIYNRYAK